MFENIVKEHLKTRESVKGKYSIISRGTYEDGVPMIEIEKWDFKEKKPKFSKEQIENEIFEQKKLHKMEINKANCQKAIFEKYPIWKQLNISNCIGQYSAKDFNIMKAFITKKRELCDSNEAKIKACRIHRDFEKVTIDNYGEKND